MTLPTVALRGVSKSYGRSVALEPLDLDLGPGVTGFLGPNGAGKTTLLRILATSLTPSSVKSVLATISQLGSACSSPLHKSHCTCEGRANCVCDRSSTAAKSHRTPPAGAC